MALPDLWRGRRGSLWDPARDPFRGISQLQRDIDRMFQDFLTPVSSELNPIIMQGFAPTCDIEDQDDAYLLTFDMPGVKKEDIRVDVADGQLTVSGERKQEHEEKERGRQYSERFYGTYSRSFTLPAGIKSDQVEADYHDGVLEVVIPKSEAGEGKHQIKIGERKQKRLEKGKTGAQASESSSSKESQPQQPRAQEKSEEKSKGKAA